MDGVIDTEVGFTGGEVPDVDYRQVCGGDTGHAEAVHVVYDPERVSYGELLEIFWSNHDPTQSNGQGVNVGDQYRSAIFFHDAGQERVAKASRAALEESGRFERPIATEIRPAGDFHRAEEHHQRYYEKRGLVPRR